MASRQPRTSLVQFARSPCTDPPGWTEHYDDAGLKYFYNETTGESSWKHPMDKVFKDIVLQYRKVMADGGFWYVEDDMAAYESTVRQELSNWMELYDAHGEKFYYDRVTMQSTS